MIAPLSFFALVLQAQAPPRQAAPAAQPPVQVQMGYSVEPDTVAVGDPFVLTVRVRAPLGASVELPAGPDSGAAVEALDPKQERQGPDSTVLEVTGAWRLAAWDIGDQLLRLGDVVVKVDGRERRLPLNALKVFVRSVLPADSAQRVPKPQRALFEFGRPWWQWLLAILAALGIVGLFLWWWFRRRKRQKGVVEDPYAEAEAEFERVERLGLVEAGERGRYVALMVEVLRTYLARRVPEAHPSLTTSELLISVRETRTVPVNRLALILADADLVKFARRATTAERARELGAEARGIVAAVRAAEVKAAEDAQRAATEAPKERAA
ncbi:MAG TPA: hypothetical protein VM076_13220 [Gemmatimonadaceae bacterium]|nr:hypothetical protein [Gemmatimonadaceae bacterium]